MARAQNLSKVVRAFHKGGGHGPAGKVGAASVARAQALSATEHANAVNTKAAHTEAVAAHHRAAEAATSAGLHDGAKAHREQANRHSFAARNTATKTAGAFGTDPATGNTQSKAQVSGPRGDNRQGARARAAGLSTKAAAASNATREDSPRLHQKAAEAHSQAAQAHALAGNTTKAAHHADMARSHGEAAVEAKDIRQFNKNAPKQVGRPAQKPYANGYSSHAQAESSRANTAGTPEAHTKAAQAHREAANAHYRGSAEEAHHKTQATYHEMVAREGGKAKLDHGVQTGGGPNNATRIPAHPRMLGASLHGKPSAGAINLPSKHQTTSATGNDPHGVRASQDRHAAAVKAGTARATGAGGRVFETHANASAHAAAQSAKARAKPSLISHSLAAKAHDQAAAVHPAGSAMHTTHTSIAQEHRAQAKQHSQRIHALKKLGPGQHHGAKGQFTGTPGGAK